MLKACTLINNMHLPNRVKEASTAKKYNWIKNAYSKGDTYIVLNNSAIFGPYPTPEKPWDISEAQKVVIYNQEVAKVLAWVMTRIVINLSSIDYKTLGVLIRIATGMLDKCQIPKELKIMYHDNMVRNLQTEHTRIVLCDLPFQG